MTEPETYPTPDGGYITGHIPTRYEVRDCFRTKSPHR